MFQHAWYLPNIPVTSLNIALQETLYCFSFDFHHCLLFVWVCRKLLASTSWIYCLSQKGNTFKFQFINCVFQHEWHLPNVTVMSLSISQFSQAGNQILFLSLLFCVFVCARARVKLLASTSWIYYPLVEMKTI